MNLNQLTPEKLQPAAKLLSAYCVQGANFLGKEVTLVFDHMLDEAYLADTEGRIARVDGRGRLKQFFTCPSCFGQGFDDDWNATVKAPMQFVANEGYCSASCKELKYPIYD